MSIGQVEEVCEGLDFETPTYVSVFAGRVADSGIDPVPHMVKCLSKLQKHPKASLIWASTMEVFNILQADQIGCHIITVTNNFLGKMSGIGKDLEVFSMETVQMFRRDALKNGYTIDTLDK